MDRFSRSSTKTKRPTTTTEHEETGAETAFAEGTGGGGQAANPAETAEGTGGGVLLLGDANPGGVKHQDNGNAVTVPNQHHDNGDSGLTQEQLAKLFPTSQITHVSGAYCPKPQDDALTLGYETLVRAVQRHPAMRRVEKTDVIKEIHYEEQSILVPKTRVITEKVKHIDQIIVVRRVPKTRIKTVYRVVQETVEVTEMEDVVDYIDVPRIEEVPRYVTENVEEKISVPVLRERTVPSTVEVPTKQYCDEIVADFSTPPLYRIKGGSASDHDEYEAPALRAADEGDPVTA